MIVHSTVLQSFAKH